MGKKGFGKKLTGENVRHFRLVPRSQYDPEEGDGATPYVLEPFVPKTFQRKKQGADEADLLNIPESLEHLAPYFGIEARGTEPVDPLGSKPEELLEDHPIQEEDLEDDCYFPKDGYNYEKHLKSISRTGKVMSAKPQSANKSSSSSMPSGPTTVRGPGPVRIVDAQPADNDEEAEVLKALDDAEEFDEADEEFLEELLPSGAVDPELVLWGPTSKENEDIPDIALFKAAMRGELGAEYELEEIEEESDDEDLTRLRDQDAEDLEEDFDQVLEEDYAENEIGAMEDEDIEGKLPMEACEEAVNEYVKGRENEQAYLKSMANPHKGFFDKQPRMIDKTRAIVEKYYHDEAPEDDDVETASGEDEEEDESRQWDCETVLSTLSNLSNRPGKIGRIKVLKKKPLAPPAAIKEEAGSEEEDDGEGEEDDAVELPEVVTERPRGETTEERKQRKAAVKEMRKLCRKMKKDSRETYKTEAMKLAKPGTGDIRPKSRCMKL